MNRKPETIVFFQLKIMVNQKFKKSFFFFRAPPMER